MLCGAAVNRFVFHTMLWTVHTRKDKKGRGDIARRRIIIINKSLLNTSSNSYERWLGSKGSRLVLDPCTRQALRYSKVPRFYPIYIKGGTGRSNIDLGSCQ